MSDTNKKRGRPAKGNDARISVRLSTEQDSMLTKYCRDYGLVDSNGYANKSEAIRRILDQFPAFPQDYFDDFIMDTLVDVAASMREWAKAFRVGQMGEAAHDFDRDASAILTIASILQNRLSYEDNRPNVSKKAFTFTRRLKKDDEEHGRYEDFNSIEVKVSHRKFDREWIAPAIDQAKIRRAVAEHEKSRRG